MIKRKNSQRLATITSSSYNGHHHGNVVRTSSMNGSNNSNNSTASAMNQRNMLLKLICFILYSLGLVSLVLVLLMAQRLESGNSRSFRIFLDLNYDASKRSTDLASVPALLSKKIVVIDIPTTEEAVDFQKIDSSTSQSSTVQRVKDTARKFVDAVSKNSKAESRALYHDSLDKDGRLVDARLADSVASTDFTDTNDQTTTITASDSRPSIPVVVKKQQKSVQIKSMDDENVLVVIISNRRDGIIPTVASILRTTSKPVDVVLIGVHSINEEVNKHFGKRINDFTSLSVKDIENDLVKQGFKPIWTWPEWHTTNDPAWKNENTLHVGAWDNLDTHAHELNHIRFYLPHVSIFKEKQYFYFMDDDLLISKDLGVLATKTMNDLSPKHGLVCACNIWMWNSECFHFEFQTKKDYILSMPSLYGDREVCKTDSESHCVPPNYWDFVNSFMPEDGSGKDQYAWNFGFSLFALNNWRELKLTEKYEHVMKESYRLHVFPETSLTFGLGVSYIAFAGNVECWNEEYVQVRDGFGFIEWDRYAATFGDNFYDDVAVAHYTGPDKPWVNESRIELRAINPWLKMMELENMTIPIQLPIGPTNNLFTLLGSDRAGAQWIMSVLDKHPQVCASGEADKPETGFPADVLLPEGLPWYPYCSIKRGCTYEFVSTKIKELVSNMTNDNVPLRCVDDATANSDPIANHIPRLCQFIKKLNGNFHDDNIAKLWVDAFVTENRELIGCGCVRGVKAKGLKVMSEWILPAGFPYDNSSAPFINLSDTKVRGSKIIRLKRKNVWARYKSMLMAQQTGVYHPITPGDKKNQIATLKELEIDVSHMEWHMTRMEAIDLAGDAWAKEHASDILWLDYDDCRAQTADCFKRIYEFIGVDQSQVAKKAEMHESSFASFAATDSTMDFVSNKGLVTELLGTNGWDHYVRDLKYRPIQFLIYEESSLVVDSRQYLGINTSHYGQDSSGSENDNRYTAVLPKLKSMDSDTLVVLSSDRDGRVNFPVGDHDVSYRYLYEFRKNFERLTKDFPGSIVVSTDSDCCSSALTHVNPGDYFGADGSRASRACFSGESECQWNGSDKARPWQVFMQELAKKRSGLSSNIYLDSSLLVGRAGDLEKIITSLNINRNEDDRAVLTDFMYRNPQLIVLDYEQQLLGENRKNPLDESKKQCFATSESAVSTVRHLDTVAAEKQPLFMYSPRDLGCGDHEKHLAPSYPLWDSKGIVLKPILDHLERVAEEKASIVLPEMYGKKPDYRQGPEVPYIVDDKGVWTSNQIREKTNNETMFWRMVPTESLVKNAQQVLMREDVKSGRWNRLKSILRTSGFPYWAWYGDFKTCNYRNYEGDSIPIFTTCAMVNCTHAFPMPNYMTIIDTQKNDDHWRGVFKQFQEKYPWESKIRKVGWRGALSEAEWTNAKTSVRWRVAMLVHELNSDKFDVGLTGIPSWLTEKVDFDLSQIGGFKEGISPMSAFQQYIAILDMDGNSWSSRFGSLLCYNSVVIKVEPNFFDYFYSELTPWTHYIPVRNDLSDLQANVDWALDPMNELAVKNIISTANDWCSKRIVPDELTTDLLDIFESYVRLLDRADPDWEEVWRKSKDELMASSTLSFAQI